MTTSTHPDGQKEARPVSNTVRNDEPFSWFDDVQMKQAEHPLAVVGRAVQLLYTVAFGADGEGEVGRAFDGIGQAVINLAKSKQYDTLGWLLYGLEATVKPEYRRDWPLSETGEPQPRVEQAEQEEPTEEEPAVREQAL